MFSNIPNHYDHYYQSSHVNNLLNDACTILGGSFNKELDKPYYTISENISDRMAKDLEEIVVFSVKGYGNEISPNNIKHIEKKHGTNGTSDNSMKNHHDLAKIAYVIETYDDIREGKFSNEFKNSDGTYAKTVELHKKIDNQFFM